MMDSKKKKYSEDEMLNATLCMIGYIGANGGSLTAGKFFSPSNFIAGYDSTRGKPYFPDIEQRFVGLMMAISMEYVELDIRSATIFLTEKGQGVFQNMRWSTKDWREAML